MNCLRLPLLFVAGLFAGGCVTGAEPAK